MRSKELSDDYRYFPEPDLLPVVIDEAFIAEVARSLPELPAQKRARYVADLGLSDYDAAWLTDDPSVARFFESVLTVCGEAETRRELGDGRLVRGAESARTARRTPAP